VYLFNGENVRVAEKRDILATRERLSRQTFEMRQFAAQYGTRAHIVRKEIIYNPFVNLYSLCVHAYRRTVVCTYYTTAAQTCTLFDWETRPPKHIGRTVRVHEDVTHKNMKRQQQDRYGDSRHAVRLAFATVRTYLRSTSTVIRVHGKTIRCVFAETVSPENTEDTETDRGRDGYVSVSGTVADESRKVRCYLSEGCVFCTRRAACET